MRLKDCGHTDWTDLYWRGVERAGLGGLISGWGIPIVLPDLCAWERLCSLVAVEEGIV